MAMREAAAPGPVVEVRGLVKDYGDFHALGPVDLSLGPGATGLLGPNGAGKTTLIKALLGLVRPTAGQASVLGLDVGTRRLDVRQAVGYMPERDAYVPNMSGFAYVAYCGEMSGLPRADAKQRAHEVLNYVGLDEERYRNVETYSTGMRQKAKLAQALVHDPRLLFLDEPTNGLDPRGRSEMLDLIRDLASRRGISVVLSTHLLPDVEHVCPDVVVLNRGAVAAQGSLEELQKPEGGVWIVRIKGDADRFLGALKKAGLAGRNQDGYFEVDLPARADPNRILDAAAAAGGQVRHLTPRRASLEDLFMQLVETEA